MSDKKLNPPLGGQLKRKICFVITSFIHYSRNFLVLEELNKREDVELHIIIGGAAVIKKYFSKGADLEQILKKGDFTNVHKIYFNLEGTEPTSKAKTAGLATIEFATLFREIAPDLVVARGDRFEVLAAATAASFMNIPIAHIEGGDISGSIDESVRHAITKLSHIHFATSEESRNRILKMGEKPDYVFNFGSPDVEVVKRYAQNNKSDWGQEIPHDIGSGVDLDLNKDFLMVMYHPVATEIGELAKRSQILLASIHTLQIPTIWFWPNFDAGADEISHEIRNFKEITLNKKIRFLRYILPEHFIPLLTKTKCLIGNSSAAVKECSWLGVPAVNVGTRQSGRKKADNVIDVGFDEQEIKRAIKKQIAKGRYEQNNMFYQENSSAKIAQKLAEINLYVQKQFINN